MSETTRDRHRAACKIIAEQSGMKRNNPAWPELPNREFQLADAMREYALPRMREHQHVLLAIGQYAAAGNLAEEIERCETILAWGDADAR